MKYKPIHKLKLDLNENYGESKEKFESINCPSCSSGVDADNLFITDRVGKCNSCNVVFSIEEVLHRIKTTNKIESIELPVGVEKYYYGDELDLTFQQSISVLEVIAAILLPLASLGVFGGYAEGEMPLFFPVFFLCLTILSLVNIITSKRHKTEIRVSNESLIINNRPKKFRKNKSVDSSTIEQIYTKRFGDTNSSQYFGVVAVVNKIEGQTHEVLIPRIKTIREAKFIEQEIEKHLGIENKEMLEEAKGA